MLTPSFALRLTLGFQRVSGKRGTLFAVQSRPRSKLTKYGENLRLPWYGHAKITASESTKLTGRRLKRTRRNRSFPRSTACANFTSFYTDYSELGTHPSISALALRHNSLADEKDMTWRHEYLDARAERIAPFLLNMLTACALVEKAFFDSFSQRLDLDVELARMRKEFALHKKQAADWIVENFKLPRPQK
jgi:hypothetical protein